MSSKVLSTFLNEVDLNILESLHIVKMQPVHNVQSSAIFYLLFHHDSYTCVFILRLLQNKF